MFARLSLAATLVVALNCVAPALAEEPVAMTSSVLDSFEVPEINQAIGVDADQFYAIDNTSIAKYAKDTKKLVLNRDYEDIGAIHFDSAVVVDGKIYIAHSNYPVWPMTSSLEIFDAVTLDHLESHSFGIQIGSFTWVDQAADGTWWGGFANYNRVFDKSPVAYGNKYNTQIVRFTPDWRVAEAWVLPPELLEKFGDMSNSGASWGPDGKLWITGHDDPEVYALALPEAGSMLRWVGTAPLDIAGQGVAWDRTQQGVIWGVVRDKEKGENRVTAARVQLP